MSDEVKTTAADQTKADTSTEVKKEDSAADKTGGGASTVTTEPAVKTEAEKTSDGKAAESESKVPEKYELKLQDGSLLDSTHVEKVASYAKELGLSNENAQKLLERDNQLLVQANEKTQAAYKQTVDVDWPAAILADKEIGGDAMPQNMELARRVIDRFGSEDFKKHLGESRLGNHPELVRIFNRIGKAMSEDQLIIPGASSGGEKKSHAEMLYGK